VLLATGTWLLDVTPVDGSSARPSAPYTCSLSIRLCGEVGMAVDAINKSSDPVEEMRGSLLPRRKLILVGDCEQILRFAIQLVEVQHLVMLLIG